MPAKGQKSQFSPGCQKTTNEYLGTTMNVNVLERAFVCGSVSGESVFTMARRGFTLFEVSISLAIVAFAVVSILMLFPAGIKMQQQARFQFLASVKAMELIEYFSGKSNAERLADFEAPEPWDARVFCYTNTRWDLEHRLSRFDSGIMPLPLDIARRLDSDGDEIQKLVSQGAYLYYADPRSVPGIDVAYKNPEPPNDAHKLVFAVSGYAQNNAVPIFPYKAWPYRAQYPSPPIYYGFGGDHFQAAIEYSAILDVQGGTKRSYCVEGWQDENPQPISPAKRDPLLKAIFDKTADYNEKVKVIPDGTLAAREIALKPLRDQLAEVVLLYCEDKYTKIGKPQEYTDYIKALSTTGAAAFLTLGEKCDKNFDDLCIAAQPLPADDKPTWILKEKLRTAISLRVQSMRYLAFMMGTYNQARSGEPIPTLSGIMVKDIPLSMERLRYYHDRCLYFAMRYSASFPYDWGAPRPLNRSIMTDYPLIEFDLYSQPRSGAIMGTSPSVKAAMWRPISAQRVTGIGLPATFPGAFINGAFNKNSSPFTPEDGRNSSHPLWGNPANFSLTKPFSPAERCRQLVFWSVDWQAYEDAELSPSAPLDASRCMLRGVDTSNQGNYDSRLNYNPTAVDALHFRNPERELIFRNQVSHLGTGSPISEFLLQDFNDAPDGGSPASRQVLNGRFGADRNNNYKLDRGPLPRSARQRATLVGRFNFYDPRLPIVSR